MPRINQAGKNAEKPAPKTEAAQQPAAPANDAAAAGTESQVTSTDSVGDAESSEPESEPDQDPETSSTNTIDNSDQPTQPDAEDVAEQEPNQADATPDLTITDRETVSNDVVAFMGGVKMPGQFTVPDVAIMRADEIRFDTPLSENDPRVLPPGMSIDFSRDASKTIDMEAGDDVKVVDSVVIDSAPRSRRSIVIETDNGPVIVPLDRLPVHCVPVKWAMRDKAELTLCESDDGVVLQEDVDAINRNFVQPE